MPATSSPDLTNATAYAEMVDDIIAAIDKGELQAGQRLASEPMLKEQYGISISSIKRGLAVLVDRGMLTRRQGSGTYVTASRSPEPQLLVRRDTVSILRAWEYWRYHPFFSEQHKGLLAGLAKHGWKTLDLQHEAGGDAPANRDTSYRNLSSTMVRRELDQHPEVAGVVCMQGTESMVNDLAQGECVLVGTRSHEQIPYVCYDWQAETERLFRIGLMRGARSFAVVSSFAENELREQFAAAGTAACGASLTCLQTASTNQGTALISQAYELTREAFSRGDHVDALVITSDFEAQGVTDALLSLPHESWAGIQVLALLNRASRLHAQIPMTTLVSDGWAMGMVLADLLHEHITDGDSRRRGIVMSCTQEEWC